MQDIKKTQSCTIDFSDVTAHAEIISEALDGISAGEGFLCFCPAHDDEVTGNRSLKVEADTDTDKVLLDCKSGCDFNEISSALRDLELWPQTTWSKGQRLWHSADTDNMPLLPYFRSRGITDLQELPESLRCHDTLFLTQDDPEDYLGIVAAVRDEDEKFVTAYKIFLSADGTTIADVPHPKAFIAGESANGGHVTLCSGTSGRLHVAEGIETSLAVLTGLPEEFADDSVWAALTTSNLKELLVSNDFTELWIWADNDKNEAGVKAARALAERMLDRGIRVKIILPETTGSDWLTEYASVAETSIRGIPWYESTEPWLRDGCAMQEPYFMKNGGIWTMVRKGKKEFEVQITEAPVWLHKCFDEFDTDFGIFEIGYVDLRTDRWKTVKLPRGTALDASKLKAAGLQIANFPVHPDKYKLLVNFLFACEQRANHVINYTTNRVGWHKLPDGPLEYAPYSDRITTNYTGDGISERINAFKPLGSSGEWVLQAEQVFDHGTRAVWPFAAALAAPLIRPLGLRSFVIDMFGMSSTGKTLAAKFGLSVYGEPSKIMLSFDATDVGVERNAYALNDALVLLDESQKVERRKAETVKTWIYRLSNEQGKEKGSGAEAATQRTLTWKNITVVTGERSVKTFMGAKWGGLEARTISVHGSPFEVDDVFWAQGLEASIQENCGHLGPIWIKYIQGHLAEIQDGYNRNYDRLLRSSASAGRIQNRKAPYYAVLLTAIDFLPKVCELPVDMIALLRAEILDHWQEAIELKTYDQMAYSALSAVHTYFVENQFKFVQPDSTGEEGPFDIDRKQLGGRVHENGDISFTLNAFKDALKTGGFELESIIEMFLKLGWLIQSDAERKYGTGQHSIKIHGKVARTYTVSGNAFLTLHVTDDQNSEVKTDFLDDQTGDAEFEAWQKAIDSGMLPYEERHQVSPNVFDDFRLLESV